MSKSKSYAQSARQARRFLIVTMAKSILSFKKGYTRKYKSQEASFNDITVLFRKHTTEIIESSIKEEPELQILAGVIDRFCYNLSRKAIIGADKYIKDNNTPMVFYSFIEHLSLGLIDSMCMTICDWDVVSSQGNKDKDIEGQLKVDIEINYDKWSFRWYGKKEILYSNCEIKLNDNLFSKPSTENNLVCQVIKPVAFEFAKHKQLERKKSILQGRRQDMLVLQNKLANKKNSNL